jgi:hypothetical protein
MGLCIQDNKLNGVIKRYFRKEMRKEIQVPLHNAVSRLARVYDGDIWVLKKWCFGDRQWELRDKLRIEGL